MSKAQTYFQEQFLSDIKQVGAEVYDRYAPLVEQYRTIIIPFQSKRLKEHQSLIFENSTLETDKMELLNKIQKLKAENERLEYSLEKQQLKISQLQRHQQDLERLNLDHQSQIESLRISNSDLSALLERRDLELGQVQKDKSSLLQKFEAKNGDYNILLANYMKDKNVLAEKLNQMNELQQNLLDKQKQLRAQKFYLQKQWEEFDEAMKKSKGTTEKPPTNDKKSRIFGAMSLKEPTRQEEIEKAEKNANNQILRTPLKKLIKHHQSEIYDLSMNYNGNLVASCGGDRVIKIFDIPNLRPMATITSHSAEGVFISLGLNYGGDRLLAGSTDKKVTIFNSQTGKEMHSFPGHGDKVNSVSWASTKEKCISGSQDKQLKVWDIQKASNILSIACGRSVKVPVVYTGHGDGSVRVYSVTQGNSPVSQIKGALDYPISSITLMSNRHQVLVTSLEGSSCLILDMKMNKSIAKFEHKDFFNSATHACLSPSQGLVLAGNCDGCIYYWNRFKGEMIKKISGHDGSVTAMSYNFMSSLLASADKEGSMIIWQ